MSGSGLELYECAKVITKVADGNCKCFSAQWQSIHMHLERQRRNRCRGGVEGSISQARFHPLSSIRSDLTMFEKMHSNLFTQFGRHKIRYDAVGRYRNWSLVESCNSSSIFDHIQVDERCCEPSLSFTTIKRAETIQLLTCAAIVVLPFRMLQIKGNAGFNSLTLRLLVIPSNHVG